jgi:hypothetical protein
MKTPKFLLITLLSVLLSKTFDSYAQVKIGTNPTTIGANSNLEIESTSNNKVVVQKSNGNMGVGTSSPGNKLEVNSGTTNTSGLRFTQLQSSSPATAGAAKLGVNSVGDVVIAPKEPSLYAGTVSVRDIYFPGSENPPTSGYFTSAVSTMHNSGSGFGSRTVIYFPDLGTTDYVVNITMEATKALLGGYSTSQVTQPVVLNKNSSNFTVYLREYQQIEQDIKLNIMLVK